MQTDLLRRDGRSTAPRRLWAAALAVAVAVALHASAVIAVARSMGLRPQASGPAPRPPLLQTRLIGMPTAAPAEWPGAWAGAARPRPRTAPTRAAPDKTSQYAWMAYVPSSLLERPALPTSAPDPAWLTRTPWSGLPIRLRLFIDERGKVTRVTVLQAMESDAEAAWRLRRMFRDTGFLPGRQGGRDVPSYMDLELRASDLR